jgi:CO/xanthine dehydrogenase FAD-binding subunit
MKPPRFDYLAPATVEEALGLLAEHGDQAKVLAGGQSLVPLLNFRLVRPAHIVDLNELTGLDGIREEHGWLVIGGMTRQRAVEDSALVRERCPLLAAAMPHIGHTQIRNRGTIGGSIAHADPAAELPAVVAALGGELVARSAGGTRTLTADTFFVSYLTSALEPTELLVQVRLPVTPPRTGVSFMEVSRRHGDFALVGVAATLTLDAAGVCTASTVALTGVGPTPVVAREAVKALVGVKPTTDVFEEVGRRVSAALHPDSDLHASSDYRQHVAGVLTRRALAEALPRAQGGVRSTNGHAKGARG